MASKQDAAAADTRAVAEWTCAKLMTACYTLMDLGDYEASAALFSADAVWVRGGVEVKGPAAILEALNKRKPDEISRHLITNILVTVSEGGDEAEAVAYFAPLRAAVADDGNARLAAPAMVGDLSARFRREERGWKVTFLQPRPRLKA